MNKKEHAIGYRNFDNLCQKLGRAPQVRSFEVGSRAAGAGQGGIKFIVSSGGTKRDGHVVEQDGWDLKNYRSNPVVLWAHDYSSLPVGKSISTAVESIRGRGKCLTSVHEWEAHQFASDVRGLYERGTLNAVSAGWSPIEYEFIEGEDGYYTGIRFLKQELLEYSCVPVPADPDALKQAFSSGSLSRDLLDSFTINRAFGSRDEDRSEIYYLDFPALSELPTRTWIEVFPDEDENNGENEVLSIEDLAEDSGAEADIRVAGDAGDLEPGELKDRVPAFGDHQAPTRAPDDGWNATGARARLKAAGIRDDVTGVYFDAIEGRCYGEHHDIVGGALVTNPRALAMAMQRLLRGEYPLSDGLLADAVSHLDSEAEVAGLKARASGYMAREYSRAISSLKSDSLTGEERDFFMASAVDLGKRLFGAYRLLESWESSGDIAFDLARAIAPHIRCATPELAEEIATSIVDKVSGELRKAVLAKRMVAEMLRVTGLEDTNQLLGWVRSEFPEEVEVDLTDHISRLSGVISSENSNNGLDENDYSDIKDNEGTSVRKLTGLLERLIGN